MRHAGVDLRQDSGLHDQRTSIPVGVPRKSSAQPVRRALAELISYMSRVYSSASAGVPPTNWTTAGAPPIAKPPRPAVSVMALSPMSGLASPALNPGK